MNFGYQIENLIGPVFDNKNANIAFNHSGNTIIVPVSNRIFCVDLLKHKSFVFPIEARTDLDFLRFSPNDSMIAAVDTSGGCQIISMATRSIVHTFHFKEKVGDICFSPCGQYICAAVDKLIKLYAFPGWQRQYTPFRLLRTIVVHHGVVTCLKFSHDSRFILSGSEDSTVSITPVHLYDEEAATYKCGFSAHRDEIVNVFFVEDTVNPSRIVSVDRGAAVIEWHFEEDEWKLQKKTILEMRQPVRCCDMPADRSFLACGFANGAIGMYETGTFVALQTLSVSRSTVDALAVDHQGAWIALGIASLGQLVVWEWQAETYVLKQQGHLYGVDVGAFSSDDSLLATAGSDGKIKVWSMVTGYPFATFSTHTAPVTGLKFLPNDAAVVSCSLDGSVRCFDMVRLRNFRTMVTHDSAQLSCVGVDPSGEIVAAGSYTEGKVYLFSMRDSKQLDVVAGHEAPISCVAFAPPTSEHTLLASGSWDGNVRVTDIFAIEGAPSILQIGSDVLDLSWHPDGRRLCTVSLNGEIQIWSCDGDHIRTIDARADCKGGRLNDGFQTARNQRHDKYFSCVSFSNCGEFLVAGGNSKYLCLYSVDTGVLINRESLCEHRDISGILEMLDSRKMTEAGAEVDFDWKELSADERKARAKSLPGVKVNPLLGERTTKLSFQTKSVVFSPAGNYFVANSILGSYVFSKNQGILSDLYELDLEITPDSVKTYLADGQFTKALVGALKLGDKSMQQHCFYAVPQEDVDLVVRSFWPSQLSNLFDFLGEELAENSKHIEFILMWVQRLLRFHDRVIRMSRTTFSNALRTLQRNINASTETTATALQRMQGVIDLIHNADTANDPLAEIF
ncbi:hypothetical protein PCE1_004233 [Barthelona sp. PCE]